MKKSLLVLSICALFASDVMADAQVSGSVGVEAGSQNFKKSKKVIKDNDTLRFKKLNNFFFGLFADCNYNVTPDVYVGLDIAIDFMNKKAKLNIDEESLVAGLMSVDTKPTGKRLLTKDEVIKDSTGLKAEMSDVLGLFADKKFLSIRYKTVFTLGAHFGYRFNSTVFAELGLAWARLNAKYKTTNVASADDLKKFIATEANVEVLYNKLFSSALGITATDGGVHSELGKKLIASLTDAKVNKAAKIKKNGLRIRGLVGFNVASNCAIHVAVNYTTTIKSWGAALGVSYRF